MISVVRKSYDELRKKHEVQGRLDLYGCSRYDLRKSKPPESCVNRGRCPGAMPQSHPSELAVMVFFR